MYSNNYLKDPKDLAYLYTDHQADSFDTDKANVDKLGLDYLSMAMVYKATTEEEYAFYFENFVLRWNEMVPEIPLYCNVYYNVYNSKIQGLEGDNALSPYWSFAKALLYCTVAE
jgi:peptide/nickel transport system substrate-binding protein